AELRGAALSEAGLRGVRRARQRPGAGVPRQFRLPRGRPARDAGDAGRAFGHPRLAASRGRMAGPAALFRARMESSSCSRTSRTTIYIPDSLASKGRHRPEIPKRTLGRGRIIARPARRGDFGGAPGMTSGRSFPAALRLPWGMFARLDHSRLLRFAGLFTWAGVGLPLLLLSLPQPLDPGEELVVAPSLGWEAWAAWATFGFSYAWLTRALTARRASALDYLLLALLTGSAIAISYYSGSGLGSILLMVVACVLPWLLPLPVGIAVLA